MRERCVPIRHALPLLVDVVGTGGDGAGTINISTMAALVVAASGVPVAKHGNRAASSACGSADVLEAAGLPLEVSPDVSARMLQEVGFAFLFAPYYHPATKQVGPIRRELGIRTIFNLLGPLTNPALPTHQVVGVAKEESMEIVARVLEQLGVRGAVVHGSGSIDEVAGEGTTQVLSFGNGLRRWEIEPSDLGIHTPLSALAGGSVEACREAFLSILGGERSPRADVVALNAALMLVCTSVEPALAPGLERARKVMASGEPLRLFERAKEIARG